MSLLRLLFISALVLRASGAFATADESVRVLYSSKQLGKVVLQRSNAKEIWFEECDLQATHCTQLGNQRLPNDPVSTKLFNERVTELYQEYAKQMSAKGRSDELMSAFSMAIAGGAGGATIALVWGSGEPGPLQADRPLTRIGVAGAVGALVFLSLDAYLSWRHERALEASYAEMNPVESMVKPDAGIDPQQFYQDMNQLIALAVTDYDSV